jgi:hypothetical protein
MTRDSSLNIATVLLFGPVSTLLGYPYLADID